MHAENRFICDIGYVQLALLMDFGKNVEGEQKSMPHTHDHHVPEGIEAGTLIIAAHPRIETKT